MLFTGDCTKKFFVNLPVAGVNTAIADHFIMLFRDVADQTLYEFHNRNRFFYVPVIFVSVVMKGYKVTVIVVNSGGGNDRAAKIASDILDNGFRVTWIGFGIDVESLFVFPVTAGFYFFEGRSNSGFQLIKQGSAKGIAKESIVKIIDLAPETVIAVAAFGNETVNVRIPL